MKILIVGAGIGGLAAAAFLERKGFDVTLVERAPEFKHIGFSLSMAGNARRLLRELGIDDELEKEGYEIPWIEIANVHGKRIGHKFDLRELKKEGAEPVLTIERAKLHKRLVETIKKTELVLGTTVERIENHKDKVHVVLSNGQRGTYDLLVAADGIRSQIREEHFGQDQVHFYGWSLRFFWVPPHIPYPKGAIALSKEKYTFSLYPSLGKCSVGIYEYNPQKIDHPPLEIDDFLPYLKNHGWTREHIEDIKKEAEEGEQYYDHLKHVSLGSWYKKRIVLLGDSRHGVSPITGMGGAMAIEDAFVLADELAKVSVDHIDLALRNYAQRRTGRIKELFAMSKLAEKVYFIKSRWQRIMRDFALKILPRRFTGNRVKKIVYGFL